jgi:isopropylmalate/homocitrate/citramalate synthase
MLPYLWTMTGQSEPEIYLGKKSGKDNLKKWLADNKLSIAEEKEGDLLDMVKSLSIELKRDLTRDEFKDLVKKVASAE